tara:strand:- start:7613 stop:7999 length:387 start_codon:yes stop_codon:yes gene_type:complete
MSVIGVDQDVLEELRAMIKRSEYDTGFSYTVYFKHGRSKHIRVRASSFELRAMSSDIINLTDPKTLDEVRVLHDSIAKIESYNESYNDYVSGFRISGRHIFPVEEIGKVLDLLKRLYSLPMTKSASRR